MQLLSPLYEFADSSYIGQEDHDNQTEIRVDTAGKKLASYSTNHFILVNGSQVDIQRLERNATESA